MTGWEGGSGERVDVKGKVGGGEVWEGVGDRTLERDGFLYDEEETREGGEEGEGELSQEGEGDCSKEEGEYEGYSEGGEGVYSGGGMSAKSGSDGIRSRKISTLPQGGI